MEGEMERGMGEVGGREGGWEGELVGVRDRMGMREGSEVPYPLQVVCSNCSQQKAYLPYMAKIERVCALCFQESKNPDRMSGDGECMVFMLPFYNLS